MTSLLSVASMRTVLRVAGSCGLLVLAFALLQTGRPMQLLLALWLVALTAGWRGFTAHDRIQVPREERKAADWAGAFGLLVGAVAVAAAVRVVSFEPPGLFRPSDVPLGLTTSAVAGAVGLAEVWRVFGQRHRSAAAWGQAIRQAAVVVGVAVVAMVPFTSMDGDGGRGVRWMGIIDTGALAESFGKTLPGLYLADAGCTIPDRDWAVPFGGESRFNLPDCF